MENNNFEKENFFLEENDEEFFHVQNAYNNMEPGEIPMEIKLKI